MAVIYEGENLAEVVVYMRENGLKNTKTFNLSNMGWMGQFTRAIHFTTPDGKEGEVEINFGDLIDFKNGQLVHVVNAESER